MGSAVPPHHRALSGFFLNRDPLQELVQISLFHLRNQMVIVHEPSILDQKTDQLPGKVRGANGLLQGRSQVVGRVDKAREHPTPCDVTFHHRHGPKLAVNKADA